jgi:23S rRNA pseudouridine1911/1915/1917 synthase
VLLFAKDPETADMLIGQFRERKPPREYVAIVAGVLKADTGTFESRLVTDRFLNQNSTNRDDEGKDAVTHYVVRQRLRDTTVVTVKLETGRRNQIRVHFAEHGHPVLGDRRYRSERADHPRWGHRRLALHARLLGFRHPGTGKDVVFESPVPREIQAFINGDRPRGNP